MSVFRPGLFHGKVALVTGGATGIGFAITTELLYLGANVVIASRNSERLSKAAEDLNRVFPSHSQPRVRPVQCSIRSEDQVKSLIESTLKTYGKIDFLVNNGGGQFMGAIADFSLKGWNAVIETNLTGTFLMCREVYNQWMKDHGGAIVNIIVDMSRGFPMMAHSGAARAGVDNLTKSAAMEWAASGVRLNAIAPGLIYSDTAAANYAKVGGAAVFELGIPATPAKRVGTVEEISGLTSFLLSPAAAFITGETIRVDGGKDIFGQANCEIEDHKKSEAYKWQDGMFPERKSKL